MKILNKDDLIKIMEDEERQENEEVKEYLTTNERMIEEFNKALRKDIVLRETDLCYAFRFESSGKILKKQIEELGYEVEISKAFSENLNLFTYTIKW